MLLTITEKNAWEQESWSHIIDLNKQEAQVVNDLLLFARLANELFDQLRKKHGRMFGASRYQVTFYDSHDEQLKDCIRLYKRGATMHMYKVSGYKGNQLDLGRRLSARKMKGAVNAIRKGQNVLYKSFENVFLKNK